MRSVCLLSLFLVLTACGTSPSESGYSLNGYEAGTRYPDHPDEEITPGDTCDRPSQRRYSEGIAYCERNVKKALKDDIIRTYDREFGFRIGSMNRGDFKIDHYISLCMGGSNDRENLWPQHKSVYILTDPIEEKLCRLMAKGHMRQHEAIATIKMVKNNLDEAPLVQRRLEDQLGE